MKQFVFFLLFAVSTATATGQLSLVVDGQTPVSGFKSEAVVGLEIADYSRFGGGLKVFEGRISDSLTRGAFLSPVGIITKAFGRFRIGAEITLNILAFEAARNGEDTEYKYAQNFSGALYTSFDVIKTDLHRVGIKACFELQRLQNKETGSTFRIGLYTSFGTNLETPAQIETCYFQ